MAKHEAAAAVLTAKEFGRLQVGDEQAFKKVYDAYVGLVQYVVARCGLNQEERDDVVQETFFKLYRSAATINEVASIKAWLAVTARNLVIDRRRKDRGQGPNHDATEFERLSEPSYQKFSNVYRREVEAQIVGKIIDEIALAETGGATFKMFYVQGLTAREIAEQTGEAVSTITTRLTRLRRKFGERIRQHIDDLHERSPFLNE